MYQKPQDLCELALPILRVLKYSGLLSYELQGKRNTKSRKFVFKSSYITLLLICFVVANLAVYVYHCDVIADLKNCVIFLRILCITIQNLGIIYTSCRKRKKIGILFSRISKLEELILQSFGKKLVYEKILKYFVKFVFPKYFIVLSIFCINSFYSLKYDYINILFGAGSYIGWIFDFNTELLITFFLIILCQLYKNFNDGIKNTPPVILRKINEIYRELYDLTIIVNNVVQGFLFYKLIADFACSIVGLYYLLITSSDIKDMFFNLILGFLGIPLIVISNLYLVHLFENVAQEVLKFVCTHYT